MLEEELLPESPCWGLGGRGGEGEDRVASSNVRDSTASRGREEEVEVGGGDCGGGAGGFFGEECWTYTQQAMGRGERKRLCDG